MKSPIKKESTDKMLEIKKMHIESYGQCFFFEVSKDGFFGSELAEIFVEILYEEKFTGTCEYYSGQLYWVSPDLLAVGLLLRYKKNNKTPNLSFWQKFELSVKDKVPENITYIRMEYAEKRAMLVELLIHGTFKMANGLVKEFLDYGDFEEESVFRIALEERKFLRQTAK